MPHTDSPSTQALFAFDNSYALLPEIFYRRCLPVPVRHPRLIAFNNELAAELGLHHEHADNEQLAAVFAGNAIPLGADPLALAYAGHQFGHFVPQLGDGRAILLGEVVDRHGIRRDIQLKGSGQTPFSRRGDGRAALGPVIREYIVSEAMHALGIRTTRSLAAVITGEQVYRETALPGAVLTRVAASHVRVGTFEYVAAQGDRQAVRQLADYVIGRHYPQARAAQNPYFFLLQQVMDAQASLIASWMHVGFIHGVMNTDNMALSGETIDYGPCAFMDHYHPDMAFSSIDRNGRYAFANQPAIAQWNMARLAETLLPLLDSSMDAAMHVAERLLSLFALRFRQYWLAGMRKKSGLFTEETADLSLVEDLLSLMHRNEADYTLTFRRLGDIADYGTDAPFKALFKETEAVDAWISRWRARSQREPQSAGQRAVAMRTVNPAYIPRNHRIEQAIQAAVERNDFSLMLKLNRVLAMPYQEQEEFADYAVPPLLSERVRETFCGT